MQPSVHPDGNLLAIAQIRALRRAAGLLLVAAVFLTLHFMLDRGAATARQAQRQAAQSRFAVQNVEPLKKIGL